MGGVVGGCSFSDSAGTETIEGDDFWANSRGVHADHRAPAVRRRGLHAAADMPQGGGQDGADFRVSETDGSCSGVVCVACFHSVNMVN